MNQMQVKYALARVDEIVKAKIAALTEKHRTAAVRLTSAERISLIRSGKAKLRPGCVEIGRYTSVLEVFDFSKHEHDEKFGPGYEKAVNALKAKAAAARDEIVLGDEAAAKALIAELDTFG